ncbi:MAG: sugar ABC transporter permease [Anaerolineae bacterium]|nr:sugar ABC transporter permease [Anaerolineae bacterium]
MAAPSMLLILVFLIVPFIMAFYWSFTNQRLISPNPTEWVGLQNFEQLLTVRLFTLEPEIDETTGEPVTDDEGNLVYPRLRTFTRSNPDYPQLDGLKEWRSWQAGQNRTVILANDPVFISALANTFAFVIIVAPVQAGLAMLLALLINQKLRGVNIFRTIYFMPVVMSMVVVSLLWRFIYDGQNGLLNSLLAFLTFGAFQPVDWLGNTSTALPAIMAMSVWQGVGFHMVIWLSGLQTIPGVLYEAADVSGANAWQKFRYVTWPGLRGTAVLILIVITMQAFSLFTQIDVMTQGGPLDATQSIVFQAVQRGFDKQNIAGGSAISVLLFMIVLAISLVQQRVTRESA